ncbi:MAG: hypothetical protein ACTHKX_04690 [Pseudolysinimonas sp.]
MTSDPTRQRDQPALTTSSGLIWLVMGGLLTVVALVVLVPLATFPPAGVALGATIAVGVLYVGMLGVRSIVRPGRRRLRWLAGLMIAIAAVGLIAVLIVAGSGAVG